MNIFNSLKSTQSFEDFYSLLQKVLHPDYRKITANHGEHGVDWPDGQGVYCIWHQGVLIYVGLTGHISVNATGILKESSQSFKNRKSRYWPYRFCQLDSGELVFQHSPKFKFKDYKAASAVYGASILVEELEIDCWIKAPGSLLLPSFVEACMLQGFYYFQDKALPKINSKF